MARSQNAFNKKEKEKKRQQKRKEKQQKKEERKANPKDSSLDAMMAYVDADGNILDSPPDEDPKKEEIDASSIEIGIPKKSEEDANPERRGRVTFFDTNKGFGFINQDGSQERFFVHQSNLSMPIQEGDKVSFIAKKGMKGMDATDVKVI
ncbi:cold shock domain-containing protein [Marinoscillum sp. MHG1-6]|uniref:cold shock domain-containing protein n=1 Tax=Marinoscillum sp. MHG1-6 TaxID=2959627 RepID=UPI002158822C|nr:cold shock domain-containing protein [Marinoscillum sp. MHG1-6]